MMSVADPEISHVLTVSDVTQSGVTLSWHIFNTHHVDQIQVDQRGIDSASLSANRRLNASSNSSHTVTLLSPGTTYEFYVQISSYGKIDRTDTEIVTSGGLFGLCV